MQIRTPTLITLLLCMLVVTGIARAAGLENTASNPFASSTSGQSSSLGASQPDFLPIDEAFQLSYFQNTDQVEISWQISPDYYLYQHRTKVEGAPDISLPKGLPYHDEYFGDVEIYRNQLNLVIPLDQLPAEVASGDQPLWVGYQGCADAGLCYPPEQKELWLTGTGAGGSSGPTSEQGQLANRLMENGMWINLALFFALGVGLALTPCVYPMYPILSGILVNQSGKGTSTRRAFWLSMAYIQGMALTYTALGLVIAQAGMQFQAALQHPYVLIGMASLLALLSLSMFGLYNLQLPAGLQTRLNNLSQRQSGGYLGVGVMGMISGLICSPCTTAPLSGALLYVAQTGDVFLGGAALYALSLGMGLPLLLLGTSSGKLLPRAGAWMDWIKHAFGFGLLAVAIVMLERILSPAMSQVLWLGLLVIVLTYLLVRNLRSNRQPARHLASGVLIAAIALSSWQIISLPQTKALETQEHNGFITVQTLDQLEDQIAQAKAQQQWVLLDLYADWCVACRQFEDQVFNKDSVQQAFEPIRLVRVDVTRNTKEDIAMLEQYQVLGLPSLLFFAPDGTEEPGLRVTGFMNEATFLAHLNKLEN